MLKTIGLTDKPAFDRNNGSRLASSKNNNNKLIFRKNNSNDESDRFGVGRNSVEYAKKLEKSKNKKMFKSQNSAKSRKKLSKSRNSTNFGTIKAKPKFLIPNTRMAFNHLWLVFTKASIL